MIVSIIVQVMIIVIIVDMGIKEIVRDMKGSMGFMTENKRFRVFKYPDCKEYGVSDDVAEYTLARFDYHFEAETLCEILNELNDEKELLKIRFKEERDTAMRLGSQCDTLTIQNQELKDKYNEQSVSYEELEEQVERLLDFKDKVFNLINGKIKLYSHKPVSAPISQPMSVNFDADMDRLARLSELEALKEELEE